MLCGETGLVPQAPGFNQPNPEIDNPHAGNRAPKIGAQPEGIPVRREAEEIVVVPEQGPREKEEYEPNLDAEQNKENVRDRAGMIAGFTAGRLGVAGQKTLHND